MVEVREKGGGRESTLLVVVVVAAVVRVSLQLLELEERRPS